MMIRSKNFLILVVIFLLSGLFVLIAQHYYDIDPNSLIACPEEATEPCEDNLEQPDLIACTADAKQCADGSYVGRIGPDCTFAACPNNVLIDVDSFEDCVAAGNEVMESYPRQCINNGEHFVEEITVSDPGEVYDCDADAMICPDGSAVGRTGPNCEFEKCPSVFLEEPIGKSPVVCTEVMKQAEFCTMEYAPVCGLVDVQCVTTPCDPVSQTFGNGCSACAQGNVISYELGECSSLNNV